MIEHIVRIESKCLKTGLCTENTYPFDYFTNCEFMKAGEVLQYLINENESQIIDKLDDMKEECKK